MTTIISRSVTPPTLEEAQAIVGGYVEMVMLPEGDQMLVNEDGLMLKLPLNTVASMIAGRPIVGDVVVLSGTAKWS